MLYQDCHGIPKKYSWELKIGVGVINATKIAKQWALELDLENPKFMSVKDPNGNMLNKHYNIQINAIKKPSYSDFMQIS